MITSVRSCEILNGKFLLMRRGTQDFVHVCAFPSGHPLKLKRYRERLVMDDTHNSRSADWITPALCRGPTGLTWRGKDLVAIRKAYLDGGPIPH